MATKAVEDRPWLAEGSEKRIAVRDLFADIAPRYDLLNSILSLRLHHRWRAYAVRQLALNPGDIALDVCCGTGDFLTQLRKAGARALGIDFCMPMLRIAQGKGHEALGQGDACRLPLRSESVDAVTVGWGIRNVPDVDAAHREIVRVLKPGGRFVSIDMARPRNEVVAGISKLMFEKLTPSIGALFGKRRAYTYLPQSASRFMTREELGESMRAAGMTDIRWQDLFLGNICVHYGRKP